MNMVATINAELAVQGVDWGSRAQRKKKGHTSDSALVRNPGHWEFMDRRTCLIWDRR